MKTGMLCFTRWQLTATVEFKLIAGGGGGFYPLSFKEINFNYPQHERLPEIVRHFTFIYKYFCSYVHTLKGKSKRVGGLKGGGGGGSSASLSISPPPSILVAVAWAL